MSGTRGTAGTTHAHWDPDTAYTLGASEGERGRLLRQAAELTPVSGALLDRVGLGEGQTALDLGCGPRGTLELMAERVGPGGRVVGVDADEANVAMAAGYAAERGLEGVEVVAADARDTGLPSDAFDLVHTRTLLINVPDPARVLEEMVRLARPGGRLVSMEPDCEYEMCHPPHPAVERLEQIFPVVFRRNGADPNIGRRLPELYRRAGLTDVEFDGIVQVFPPGHSRRTLLVDLVRSMRPSVVELGLAGEAELEELDTAAREHLEHPDTVIMSHPIFMTWGRVPA